MTRATFKCTAFNRQKNDLSTILVRNFLDVRSSVRVGGDPLVQEVGIIPNKYQFLFWVLP